jgi:hypothetical protein
MNRNSIPTLIGVFTSLLAIWSLHTFLIVDDCLDRGGSFTYDIGQCVLDNGQPYESTLGSYAIVLYSIVGFFVSFIVSTLIKKVLTKAK